MALRIASLPQPTHQNRHLGLRRLPPRCLQHPQQTVPSQQVERIASAHQRADVTQHEIPQVLADRFHLLPAGVRHHEREVHPPPTAHRPHSRNRATPLHQGTTHILDHTNSLIAISII